MITKKQLVESFRNSPDNELVDAQLIDIDFKPGFENYNRFGLLISGEYGVAEASPLVGYFENIEACIRGAISTVSKPWPEPIREKIETNVLVNTDFSNVKENQTITYKLKVSEPSDYEKVAKLRDIAGKVAVIRLDCNGAFDVETATMFAKLIANYDIEYIEQPCATNSECAMLRLNTEIPIAIDETARNQEDIEEIQLLGAADLIVLKVQPALGLHRAFELAEIWEREVVVASMMESNTGIEVGYALAKSVENLNRACGLDAWPINNTTIEPIDNE